LLITLIGKNSIHKMVLPRTVMGNYWLTNKSGGKEKHLINVEGKDGKWQITSSNYVKVITGSYAVSGDNKIKAVEPDKQVIKSVVLKEYSMHYVCIGKSDDLFILYCLPVYENNFVYLNVNKKQEILIGSDSKGDISYARTFVEKIHAKLSFSGRNWSLENCDKKYGTFVNGKTVSKTMLSNGDVIFIMGLRIIIMGSGIFINNPFNRMSYNNDVFTLNTEKEAPVKLKPENESDLELYTEEEYFSRAPRLTNIIECEQVKIDAPPTKQKIEEMPLFYVVGSMISMGMISLVSIYMSIDGLAKGTQTFAQSIPAFLIGFSMLASMLLFPTLNRKYEKDKKRKYEEERQRKYKEYIDYKAKVIDGIGIKQRKILFDNYVSVAECKEIILSRNRRLWERKIEEHDFLTVRLGLGNIPLNVDIQYPEERFVMEEDNLVEILNTLGDRSKSLNIVPITMSLAQKHILALMIQKDDPRLKSYMQSLIMQLITFHSYEDLKLVFFINNDKENWEYVKMLPHTWNNTKQIRFFTDDYNDMQELSVYLDEELKNRTTEEFKDNVNYKSFIPYYLIITDDYKKVEKLKIITDILKTKNNIGFSILFISDNLMQLPNECKTFINIENENGIIFESESTSSNQQLFALEESQMISFSEECKALANIPIKYTADQILLPNNYSFMEMYDVGCKEQLNSLERWKLNNSTLSLQAPIGIDNAGMSILLDIHEKAHGPHGLIAGSTGSGKSEFIMTYILSLAVNYHPDDLTFVLIDYKGRGISRSI